MHKERKADEIGKAIKRKQRNEIGKAKTNLTTNHTNHRYNWFSQLTQPPQQRVTLV
jgi:hypothetical protein